MKTYRKQFESFRDDIYWETLNSLKDENVFVLEREIFDRMFYSVLPFRIWSHLWCCCRSQHNPDICQFYTMLQIKDRKVVKYIKKRLVIDNTKFFPADIFTVLLTIGKFPCMLIFSLVLISKGVILKIIMVCCTMKWLILRLWFLRCT